MTEKKFQVMLTFDVDAETLWTAPDPLINAEPQGNAVSNENKPSLMSMAAYGPLVAVPRILRMLDKYEIKATFFIPGKTMEKYPEMVKEIDRRSHEIGNHGYSHICPQLCFDEEQERSEYIKTNTILKELTGKDAVGFRTPSFEFSAYTMRILEEMGFLYESSMMGSDEITMLEALGQKSNIVEIPCSWNLDDAPYWLMSNDVWGAPMPSPIAVYESWSEEFEFLYEEGGNNCFCLTCHPQIIGRPGRMRMLEKLIQFIKGHANVEFVTCKEAAIQYLERRNNK